MGTKLAYIKERKKRVSVATKNISLVKMIEYSKTILAQKHFIFLQFYLII